MDSPGVLATTIKFILIIINDIDYIQLKQDNAFTLSCINMKFDLNHKLQVQHVHLAYYQCNIIVIINLFISNCLQIQR